MFWHIYAKLLHPHAHVTCTPCGLCLEFGNHICSVIYVKYVYSAPSCLIDTNDFICSIYMDIHPQYMHVTYLAYMTNNTIHMITLMQCNAIILL